jgi:nicotinate-nucleotide pyrophosphorylase (carboxylating)
MVWQAGVVMHDPLGPPIASVRAAVARALEEDLTPLGDITSALLPPTLAATADFVVRSAGVLAGVPCATETFTQVDDSVVVTWSAADGDEVDAKQAVGRVQGPLAAILTAERTALNFLCHLSGVATLTRRFVDAASNAPGVRIWDTRKTIPGLRALEKAAVRAGGGVNHRGNLSDWVLLKDNHLAVLGIDDAVARARERWPARTVHVECDDMSQVERALQAGADAVLLDNMTPDEVRSCVAAVDSHAETHGGRRPLLEVSGNVTLETIAAYAATGIDCISSSTLTMSAPVLDIGLDIEVAS